MDGYTLTDKMRKARKRFRFTVTEQALFYELLAVCNGEDWRDVFECSNVELCYALNINERTLMRARESLINAEMIYYKSGKSKRSVSSYSFTKPFKENPTTVNFTTVSPTNAPTNAPTNVSAKQPDYNKQYKTKTKTKTENTPIPPRGSDNVDFSSFMDYFNQTFTGKLPGISKMTDSRKAAVKARIAEYGKESILKAYKNILSSPFLLGENDAGWNCDFDWIFKPRNYIKILEGNYNGNGKSNSQTQSGRKSCDSAAERKKSVRELAELADGVLREIGSQTTK
jgi:hypothetical protein